MSAPQPAVQLPVLLLWLLRSPHTGHPAATAASPPLARKSLRGGQPPAGLAMLLARQSCTAPQHGTTVSPVQKEIEVSVSDGRPDTAQPKAYRPAKHKHGQTQEGDAVRVELAATKQPNSAAAPHSPLHGLFQVCLQLVLEVVLQVVVVVVDARCSNNRSGRHVHHS